MATLTPILWKTGQLSLLDQRLLPQQQAWVHCTNARQVAEAITAMVVRGAPAIGIAAAYGMALAAGSGEDLQQAHQRLAASRPTAVNLFWALSRCQQLIEKNAEQHKVSPTLGDALEDLAIAIHHEDQQLCAAIAQHGADHIGECSAVYTHCNTGALATGGVGTALGIIHALVQRQKVERIFAGETRPWLQGARLTTYELTQMGAPFELVCDSAAAHTMANRSVDWLIVGADRITANGDTANKIGTHQLAIVAKALGVKVMVAAPSTSIDLSLATGAEIEIEQRAADEIRTLQGNAIAPEGCPVFNPAFDVTPASLIDAIVTEKGVISPVSSKTLAQQLKTS